MRKQHVALLLTMVLAMGLAAQEVRDRIVVRGGARAGAGAGTFVAMPGGAHNIEVLSSMNLEGKTVKGAPYAAEAVTESVQTLADGNRIVHKSAAKLFRDSEGRTRREQTLGEAAGEQHQIIFIHDPVAGVSYTLDPSTKTARKMPVFNVAVANHEPGGEGREVTVHVTGGYAVAGQTNVMTFNRSVERIVVVPGSGDAKKESLGKRSFDGLEAEGTRTTATIPAGQMGNERPIDVVSENWYSSDLQATVMSRTTDPRMGENSYQLSSIVRGEQARFLFEVPSDYTIQDEAMKLRKIEKIEKKRDEM